MTDALREKPNAEPLPRATSAGVVVEGKYVPPPEDRDGRSWVRTTAQVQADPQTLYQMWSDLDNVPQWQEQIVKVVRTGDRTSRWTMQAGDKTLEWNSEILAAEPGRRLAWKTIDGDLHQAGEVVFEPAPGNRGTLVTLLQEFEIGKWKSAMATIGNRNPKQAVIENLRHFKALAETGEIPRVQGQPHGPRGVSAPVIVMGSVNRRRPPGFRSRAHSEMIFGRSGKWLTASMQVTVSKLRSENGNG
jgi:uncharacterized membrane protein